MAELRSSMTLTDRVSNTLNRVYNTMTRVNRVSNQANQTIQRQSAITQTAASKAQHLSVQADRVAMSERRMGNEAQRAGGKISRMWDSFKGYIGGMLAIETIRRGLSSLFETSGEYSGMQSRLSIINDGLYTQAELQEKIYQSSQRSRASYIDTANAVAKLNLLAGETFGSNEESIRFLEIMNKSFRIGGANNAERAGAMTQLTQALASGKLQGDELRSLSENAPMLTNAIAKYMNVSKGELKKLGAEGKITADIVKNAMLQAGEEVEAKFKEMPLTVSDAWQMFKNYAVQAFQPVYNAIEKALQTERFHQFVSVGAQAVNIMVNMLLALFDVVGQIWDAMYGLGQMMAENWGIIGPIIGGVVGAMIALKTATVAYNIVAGIMNAIEGVRAAALTLSTGATFMATAAQHGFNAALWASPITWIVAGIIALISVLYIGVAMWNHFTGAAVSATGIIVGVIYALGATIANVFIFIVDVTLMVIEAVVNIFLLGVHLLSLAWYGLKVVFWSVFEFLGNIVIDVINWLNEKFNDFGHAVAIVFSNVGKGVAKMAEAVGGVVDGLINAVIGGIEGLINSALDGINKMIDMVNKIPGVNIDAIGTVTLNKSNLAGAAKAWGESFTDPVKKEVKKIERMSNLGNLAGDAPEAPKMFSFGKREYLDIGKAYDSGYKAGQGLENSIGNLFDGGPGEKIEELTDFMKGNNPGGLFEGSPGAGGNPTGGKLDSVGKIEDEIDVSDEFIKLVKDIAEQKWQQNFITLKPEITNNVTVQDDRDYEDFVAQFNDDILDAVENAADGI
ncbi:tape measure protein [Aerococcaceae bacterium NML191219]|nr:tape measure protein [Aerococcaceae bacterium NML191219]